MRGGDGLVRSGRDASHRTVVPHTSTASTDGPGKLSVRHATKNKERRRVAHTLTTNQAVQQCGDRS